MDTSLNKHCLAVLSSRSTGSSTGNPGRALSFASESSQPGEALQELSGRVLETLGNETDGIVLFGSFARGQEIASSDIDLLIVLSKNVLLDRDVYSRWQFGKFSGREIAPLFVQIPAEGERIGGLWFEVALDGVVLFDRDLRLTRFLSRVRHLIAGGDVKRMVTHGHPYWVHSGRVADDYSSECGL